MTYLKHRRRDDTSAGASTRSNGRGQVRDGRVGTKGGQQFQRAAFSRNRAPGNEATWTIVKAKFPEEDGNSVQEAAAGARLTSVTEPAEGSGLTWRPEAECNAQVAVQAINSHNALPVAGSDGLRLSHLQSIIRTQFGQYDFGAGIGVFWWRIVDEPDAFPPEIWELFLQSNRPRDGLELSLIHI